MWPSDQFEFKTPVVDDGVVGVVEGYYGVDVVVNDADVVNVVIIVKYFERKKK
jgi:hypothetical protein